MIENHKKLAQNYKLSLFIHRPIYFYIDKSIYYYNQNTNSKNSIYIISQPPKMSKQHLPIGIKIRPLTTQQQHIQTQCITTDNNRILLTTNHKVKSFEYQKIFDKYSDQQQIFQHFGLSLIQDMFKGYNCCLIIYGHNLSGKTYTINGRQSQQSKGIIPRIVDHINCKLYAQTSSSNININNSNSLTNKTIYLFRVSYIDIYQQQIIDLLAIRKGIEVKITTTKQRQIQLKNLEIKSINKIEDIQSYLLMGNRKRQFAFSKKYRTSAKTTSIFTIYYEALNGERIVMGKFDIVDYQASQIIEMVELGLQLKGKKNNLYDLSMNSFKNVIQALAYGGKESTIPYNDSKVTKLLRQSIGGTSKTKLLFHITPILKCYPAIIDILTLASSCQLIQNTPTPNLINPQQSIIKEYLTLKSQQSKLQEQLIFYLETNYHNYLDKIKDQENQFINQKLLGEKYQEQYGELIQEKHVLKENINQKVNSLFNLFLRLDNLNKHQIAFFKDNYQNVITKLHQIQSKDKALGLLHSNSFNNFYPFPSSPTSDNIYHHHIIDNAFTLANSIPNPNPNKKLTEKQRFFKQQINDLKHQHQQQKQQLLNTLREVQMKYKFYQKIAKNVVKKQEIDLIKMNSKYDSTKRSFQLPLFAIRDKKIMYSSNYFSPNQKYLGQSKSNSSRANSQRRFIMSMFSQNKVRQSDRVVQIHSPHESNRSNRQISQKSSFKPKEDHSNQDYFESSNKKITAKPKMSSKKNQELFKMSSDDYQMVRSSYMQNRFKLKQSKQSQPAQNNSLSSSKGIKSIKPFLATRFRFK